ncbi:MAG: pyridoxine 5'-phosphate synthase [Tannerella sp.]|jgi:pyridoxine 5-phosphate synthase|nr:pyridoxine 5'-phosphate synthase [Tannerella sp.]
MINLSVNINKVATLRNSRGGNMPDVQKVAQDCERFGAQGITVHPRPDERHIRYDDVYKLKSLVSTELNIEGYPGKPFVDLVLKVRPNQVTLVPDAPDALTSDAGWKTKIHFDRLSELVDLFTEKSIRTSLFVDASEEDIEWAAKTGADRVELYTGPYASQYALDRDAAIAPFVRAAGLARRLGMGVNAGHDLSLENLAFFASEIDWLEEVSIGHALVCDALYFGLEKTINLYKACLM